MKITVTPWDFSESATVVVGSLEFTVDIFGCPTWISSESRILVMNAVKEQCPSLYSRINERNNAEASMRSANSNYNNSLWS